MAIKPHVIVGLLRALEEYVNQLHQLEATTVQELAEDFVKRNAILHLLQTSVEIITDICAHILTDLGGDVPDHHRLLIEKMGTVGILPSAFAARIAPMAGFRNIIVHHYLEVDLQLVADALHHQLGDFEEFRLHIYDYLRREGLLS